MKTLQFTQRMLEFQGFNRVNQPLWNSKRVIASTQMILCIPSFFIYLVHVADTDKEITDSIFITSVSLLMGVSFINTVYQRSNLSLLFDKFEENVNNRKCTRDSLEKRVV